MDTYYMSYMLQLCTSCRRHARSIRRWREVETVALERQKQKIPQNSRHWKNTKHPVPVDYRKRMIKAPRRGPLRYTDGSHRNGNDRFRCYVQTCIIGVVRRRRTTQRPRNDKNGSHICTQYVCTTVTREKVFLNISQGLI